MQGDGGHGADLGFSSADRCGQAADKMQSVRGRRGRTEYLPLGANSVRVRGRPCGAYRGDRFGLALFSSCAGARLARGRKLARGVLGWRTFGNRRTAPIHSSGKAIGWAWRTAIGPTGPHGVRNIAGPRIMRPNLGLKTSNELVFPAGFEPTAPRLGIWCSIQLSYGNPPPG